MAEQNNSQTGNTSGFDSQSTSGGNSSSTGSGASAKTAKENTTLTTGDSGTSESAGTLGNVTNKVKGLYEKAADSQVGQAAKDALGQVKDNATSAIDEKKVNIAQGLTSVADTIRQVGDSVKPPAGEEPNKLAELTTQYSETISKQVEKVSDYLENQDLQTMVRDVQGFARRNPAIFLGAAFALGVLAARFLRTTPNGGSGGQALVNRSDAAGTGFGGNLSTSSTGAKSGKSSFGRESSGSLSDLGGGDLNAAGDISTTNAADNVRQFNSGSTGSGANSTSQDYSLGSTSSGSGSTTSPKPSNSTESDFGKSNS